MSKKSFFSFFIATFEILIDNYYGFINNTQVAFIIKSDKDIKHLRLNKDAQGNDYFKVEVKE